MRGRQDEGGWKMEQVHLRSLGPGELLVRMVASGVCHTDAEFGNRPQDIGGWPRVMGHEGKESTPQKMLPLTDMMMQDQATLKM